MAKLRHVAMSAPDPEAAASSPKRSKKAARGESVCPTTSMSNASQQVINPETNVIDALCVLVHPFVGLVVEQRERNGAVGDVHAGRHELPLEKVSLYYEMKFRDPKGIIFDISQNGWVGAKK